MRSIKHINVKTTEGFSIENLQRFPSMEYGEDGGLQVDLLYNGDKIMTVYEAGNGGSAITYTTELYSLKTGELKTKALALLKRADKNWDKYDFLKKKTAKDIDDDDWLAVVNLIEERYDDYKQIEKAIRDGYKSVAILSNDFKKAYLRYKVSDITIDEVNTYLVAHNLAKQYPEINLVSNLAAFGTI